MEPIYLLERDDLAYLVAMLKRAREEYYPVRVAFDGGLKVKVGNFSWSQPLGIKDAS